MSYGIEFEGVSSEETITEEVSNTIAHDAESSFNYDMSIDLTFTCTGTEGVGLWQWVVEAADRKSSVLTGHTICRYGVENYRTPPECPWTACNDIECTICDGGWQA